MWFVPASALNGEQRQIMPTQVASRMPCCLLRVAQSFSQRNATSPIQIEEILQTQRSLELVDSLGIALRRHGSDKSTTHNYHLLYGLLLSSFNRPVKLLEIGLGSNDVGIPSNMGAYGHPGASIRAFRDVCPGSSLFGADIDQTILVEGIKTFVVDQTVASSFSAITKGAGVGFDLIIDDGLHSPDANLNTLWFALNHLSSEGYFVIEDIPDAALPIWFTVQLMGFQARYKSVVIRARQSYMFLITARASLPSVEVGESFSPL